MGQSANQFCDNLVPDYEPWRAKTLHERMMLEAEPIVKHNWLDVAIHDKRKLDSSPARCVHVWILNELGSHMIPMYSTLEEKLKIKGTDYQYLIATINHFFVRANFEPLIQLDEYTYYILIKGATPASGDIIPISLQSLMDLTSYGLWEWVRGEGVLHKSDPIS